MTISRRRRGAWAGLAGAAFIVGCRPASTTPKPLPPSTPVVHVVMREYRFEGPRVAPAGRVVFRIANAGRLHHQMTLVRLPEDFDRTLDAQLRGPTRRVFPTVATLFDRRPGQGGVFAVILDRGRYGMICFVDSGEGAHSLKGMTAELRVN